VSLFHFSSHLTFVSNHSIIVRLLYIMLHPVFESLCFSIIYFMLRSIPSSSSFGVQQYHNNASCYDLHLTASSEFSSSNTIPFSFFLTSQRTHIPHTGNIFISLILFSGDNQSNPGPVSRVRSFIKPLHYTAIADLANTNKLLLQKLGFLPTVPLLNYLMQFLVDLY